MSKKTTKKVNPKETYKNEIFELLKTTFEQLEMDFDTDYESFGFTKGTIVVHGKDTDIQIKLITPKTNVERYEKISEEEE